MKVVISFSCMKDTDLRVAESLEDCKLCETFDAPNKCKGTNRIEEHEIKTEDKFVCGAFNESKQKGLSDFIKQ